GGAAGFSVEIPWVITAWQGGRDPCPNPATVALPAVKFEGHYGGGAFPQIRGQNSVASIDLDRFHRQNSVDGEQRSVASTDFD
ncbi:hypothetical protein ACLOJK_034208, partial [Asimina triloba]